MTTFRILLSALLALALAGLAPAAAQPAPDPHQQLYDTLMAGTDLDVAMRQVAGEHSRQFIATNPSLGAIARDNPDFPEELAAALYPYLRQMAARLRGEYRDDYLASFRQHLSPDEALMLAAMFNSPAGRKIMQGATSGLVREETTRETVAGQEMSREALARDSAETARLSMQHLTTADFQELERLQQRYPALSATMERVKPLMQDVLLRMAQEPPSAEEDHLAEESLTALLARYGLRLGPQ